MSLQPSSVYSVVDYNEQKRSTTATITAWVVFFIAAVWMSVGVVLGVPEVVGLASCVAVTSLLTILMVKSGYDFLARVLWMFSSTVAIVIGHFIVHPAANTEVLLLAVTGGPFILFSVKRERGMIYFLVGMNLLIMIALAIIPQDTFGPPLVGYEKSVSVIRWFALFTTLVVVTIEMAIFAWISGSYNNRLQASNRAAQNANRAKSAFLASMSHEIRTPMNGVVGMIEVLEGSDLDNDQRRMLRTIRESSFSLLRIIDDILDTSKIEAGRLELRPAPMHLLSVVEGAMDGMRAFADERNVALILEIDPTIPSWITADSGRLRQILLNLLSNAIKFSAKREKEGKGEVKLLVALSENNHLEMDVVDNGIGMDEKMLNSLFNPFSQAEEVSKRRFGGTGLGLTIVKQLLEKMGGDVTVGSTPDIGSVFHAYIPVIAPQKKLSAPNFSGLELLALNATEIGRALLRTYVEAAAGKVRFFDTIEELIDAINPSALQVIYYEDLFRSERGPLPVSRKSLEEKLPKTPIFFISDDKSRQFGQQKGNRYAAQANPLTLSEFWDGIGILISRPTPGNQFLEEQINKPIEVAVESDPLRILVAEDNDINQTVIRHQLEKLSLKGHITSDGLEALNAWREGEYDIILTDCHMPHLNGFELTERVRQIESDENLARTPIIAVTANALSGEADQCLAAGMDDFLSKPVQLAELGKMINKWRIAVKARS